MAISKTIDLDLTPEELADAFCQLWSGYQAAFFNRIAENAKAWPGAGWCSQAHSITHDPDLTKGGREVIRALGDHLKSLEG